MTRQTLVGALLAIAVVGCGSATTSVQPLAAVPTPTPQIIYVTPPPTDEPDTEEPTDEPVVAEPTEAPTAEPTPEPTPKPTAKPSYKKLTARAWKKLVKSPDDYTGKTYQIWACIFQFDAATGDGAFLANASNKKQEYWSLYGENSWFEGNPDRLDDFVEDDIVVVNVEVAGAYSYDTQAGGNTTVPSFVIKKITRKGSCD